MSLRQIAKELGVSHTLLSLWLQGKRNLAPMLQAKYHQLVTSGYKNGYNMESDEWTKLPAADIGIGAKDRIRTYDLALMKRPL